MELIIIDTFNLLLLCYIFARLLGVYREK